MLTTELSIEHKILLEDLFHEYCLLLYNRIYPLTDNNVFNYFLDFYLWNFREHEDILQRHFLNPTKQITKEEFSISYIYCIRKNQIWTPESMKRYNEYLKNELKNVT